jgi:hypothetical protein
MGSNSVSLIAAVVRPQPGQDTPKMLFHKQGMQMSISNNDLMATATIVYIKTEQMKSLFVK